MQQSVGLCLETFQHLSPATLQRTMKSHIFTGICSQ